MKHLIISLTLIFSIFTAVTAYAGGFSFGLLGSYSINNGEIDSVVEENLIPIGLNDLDSSYDPIEIAGIILFARYDFRNNLFVRTGFERYFTLNSAQIKHDSNKYTYEYDAYTIPLYLGITLSPDRGRTSVYGAAGIYYSIIEIERDVQAGTIYNADSDTDLFGFGGIFGLERIIFNKVYFMIEYAFYTGSDAKLQPADDGLGNKYIERYSLPRQQMRVGLRYSF